MCFGGVANVDRSMEPAKRLIGEYLMLSPDQKFVIPEYQRAYTWDINTGDKLFEDIDAFRRNRNLQGQLKETD